MSKAYHDKEEWTQKCSDGLSDYAFLTRHICHNHEVIAQNMSADPVLLKSLCHSAMCGCNRDNMINASLCADLSATSSTEEALVDDVSANTDIMRKMMMIALVIVSSVITLTTLKKVSHIVIEDINA
jgi:hypothetical protein